MIAQVSVLISEAFRTRGHRTKSDVCQLKQGSQLDVLLNDRENSSIFLKFIKVVRSYASRQTLLD